ncbi:citrate lyase ACP [Escherichia coli]|nr:citrate lyase ACP [Escherichia coli]PWU63723.1 citrate lyase acyl carrier protein [Shigella sonnei]
MKINQPAVAGTLESGDVMIRIAPLDTQDIDLQINSSVEKQFGDAIRTTILDVLARYNVRGVQLNVDDKGALDCILRARLEALLARASGIPALPWRIANDFRFAATT